MLKYKAETEDGAVTLQTFQGSVELSTSDGMMTLGWEQIHALPKLIADAIKGAQGMYWPEREVES